MKFLTAISLPICALVFSMCFGAPSAQACSVIAGWPPEPAELVAQTDLVFAGSVESIIQDKSTFGDYHITFDIAETLKGSVGDTVTLTVRSSSAACGYDDGYGTFAKAGAWIIYAMGDTDEGYSTNGITGNTTYKTIDAAVAALRAINTEVNDDADTVPQEDLWLGKRGDAVTWLQEKLVVENEGEKARALATVGATGYFGALTQAALAEYQLAHSVVPAQGYYGPKTRAAMTANTPSEPRMFTGTIESVQTDCFFDGVCSVTVDGKEVVILTGERIGPARQVGSLKGVDSIGDLEGMIGSEARVYAATSRDNGADYTLYGSTDFYVHVLGALPKNGDISVSGLFTCLPAKEPNKPTIAICMFGLLGDDGRYYALRDESDDGDTLSTADSTEDIAVKGTFTAGEIDGAFHADGTIVVSSIVSKR